MILQPAKIIPLLGIEHGMTVLDIGSGIGFWAKRMSEYVGNSGKIFAVDNHQAIIQRLHHDIDDLMISNIYPITGDLHDIAILGIKSDTCHKILLIRMMPVVGEHHGRVIESLIPLLHANGEIIIIESMNYQDELMRELSDYSISEIPLVAERTDDHFFGVRISKK